MSEENYDFHAEGIFNPRFVRSFMRGAPKNGEYEIVNGRKVFTVPYAEIALTITRRRLEGSTIIIRGPIKPRGSEE